MKETILYIFLLLYPTILVWTNISNDKLLKIFFYHSRNKNKCSNLVITYLRLLPLAQFYDLCGCSSLRPIFDRFILILYVAPNWNWTWWALFSLMKEQHWSARSQINCLVFNVNYCFVSGYSEYWIFKKRLFCVFIISDQNMGGYDIIIFYTLEGSIKNKISCCTDWAIRLKWYEIQTKVPKCWQSDGRICQRRIFIRLCRFFTFFFVINIIITLQNNYNILKYLVLILWEQNLKLKSLIQVKKSKQPFG